MRLLYIHQYFRKPTEGGAIRSYYLAKSLVESGVNVDLITAHNSKDVKVEDVDGITVHYLPVKYDNKLSFWPRILAFFSFMHMSYKYAKNIKSIDLVYASSTPLTVGLTAILLKRFKGIPFYFEVRDLWPEAPIQMGAIKNGFVKWFLRGLEKSIYKNADKIITLSPGMRSGVVKVLGNDSKVDMLPNISDCEFFLNQPKSTKNTFYFGATDKFVISYLGAIGEVNKLDSLMEAAVECKKQNLKDVLFIVAGRGSKLTYLKQQAKSLKLNNIRFVGFLNREEIERLLNITDASFISFDSKPILETNSPNKFFDSIAAGKMCIVNNKGWIRDLIDQHELGFFYSKNQPKVFVEKLSYYLENRTALNMAKSNARKLAVNNFSREILTKKFVELFELERIKSRKKQKAIKKSARA